MSFDPKQLKAIPIVSGTKIALYWKNPNTRQNYYKMYKDKIEGNLEGVDIGLLCKINNLLIVDIDVAGDEHRHDGRLWWANFIKGHEEEYETLEVLTMSAGTHLYYYVPEGTIDPDLFFPPSSLAPGVDIKWDGYVKASPSPGYEFQNGKTLRDIAPIPFHLLMELEDSQKSKEIVPVSEFGGIIHQPFPVSGHDRLLAKIKRVVANNHLTRDQWRDGIFALRAGIVDPEVLETFIDAWTRGKSYEEGDVEQALSIAYSSDPSGGIGPGTLVKMLQDMDAPREGRSSPTVVAIGNLPTKDDIYSIRDLVINEKKNISVIMPTETNAAVIIDKIFNEKLPDSENITRNLYFDNRKRAIFYQGKASEGGIKGVLKDTLKLFQSKYHLLQFKAPMIQRGLEMLIDDRRIDPLKYKIEKYKWNGEKRLKTLFTEYVDAEGEKEYLQMASQFFLCSLTYRILQPGIKCDTMLILKGVEEIYKSTFCEVMAQGYYYSGDHKDTFTEKDYLMGMQRSAVTELAEMVAFQKTTAETVKGYISRATDSIRMPYDKEVFDHPRSFVLVGTTNQERFLTMGMGQRRFLPVEVKSINTEKLKEDLPQLMAEAIHCYESGEELHKMLNLKHSPLKKFITEAPYERLLGPIGRRVKNRNSITVEEIGAILRTYGIMGPGGLSARLKLEMVEAMEALGFQQDLQDKDLFFRKEGNIFQGLDL